MAIKIVSYIIVLIITIVSVIQGVKMYKESQSPTERVLYILFLFVYFIPIIVYLLDRYNVPTTLGIANGINMNRWFEFISSYIIGIIGAIISGVFVVLITLKQIKTQIESNKEDKRIENAPIFNYSFHSLSSRYNYNHTIEIGEYGDTYHLYFKMENIGLNHSKNINILIKVDEKEDRKFSLNGYQSFIKKNETVCIDLILTLNNNNHRKIIVEVYYEDLLNNKYMQRINTMIIPVNKIINSLKIDGFNVENAKLLGSE
ncbi:MAG: hypothetical protein VZS44_05655 [Bacilli bacterium]|nr:hypothetical protein [Bacilli bacterium]